MNDNTNPFLGHARDARLVETRAGVLRWYERAGRHHLPWRQTADPYAIYISEIMLQQTQVKTVLERYYFPFLAKFPTLAALAHAPREAVVKAWEGLGYYSRAANLHAAAKRVTPALPATVEALMALPGVGRNTAHAVASFGFGVPVPVMEANVKRVLCRVFALQAPRDPELWGHAEWLFDAGHPFAFNQAMMDIGAFVCTKRRPACMECPLSGICAGKLAPESYPAPKAAKQLPVRPRIIAAFHDGAGRYCLAPRAGRFLQGLYGFPEFPEDARALAFGGQEYAPANAEKLGAVCQTYSHFRLEAHLLRFAHVGGALPEGFAFFSLPAMEKLPLSGADHQILRLLAGYRA